MDFEEPTPEQLVESFRSRRSAGRTIHEEQRKEMQDEFHSTISQTGRLIQELTTDQIKIFQEVVEQASDGSGFSNIVRGMCMSELMFTRGLLPDGTSYEESFARDLAAAESELVREQEPATETETRLEPGYEGRAPEVDATDPREWTSVDEYEKYVSSYHPDLMQKYVLFDVRLEEGHPNQRLTGRVLCNACGVMSINLEDRMLREPGVAGCGSCQKKTKWG